MITAVVAVVVLVAAVTVASEVLGVIRMDEEATVSVKNTPGKEMT